MFLIKYGCIHISKLNESLSGINQRFLESNSSCKNLLFTKLKQNDVHVKMHKSILWLISYKMTKMLFSIYLHHYLAQILNELKQ